MLDSAKSKMNKAIDNLVSNLKTIRTGVANAALLDHVEFEYWGMMTPINQVASIKVVEGRQLVVTPYDKGALQGIERALLTSDTGLVPQSDGTCIRLNVPALTQERRKEFKKHAEKMGEETKVAIRNIRRDINDQIKKNKELPEDEAKRLQEKVQKITDESVKKVDSLVAEKSAEIMKV